ncbi:DUF4397 domain-containing protein [candidate division KSB1 bacterium]|nr:DUF4397 domain-containing protein [candidate division KSB1 bacterium]
MKKSLYAYVALFVVLLTLPSSAGDMARLQVIHNAADPAVKVVDIYIDGELKVDDFAFRTATPFIDVPAEVKLNIGIAPGNSSSVKDAIAMEKVVLEKSKSYVAIANGVLDPSQFAANPDGKKISFALFTKADAQESGKSTEKVDFVALHGTTDAPAVDVIARDVATLVEDAAYGDITDYISVPAASYILDVTPAMDNQTIVASFTADLSGLGGGAAVVFASGFLSPMDNMNGEAFGLFAALPDGQVVPFPPYTEKPKKARLQIIHNAADPAAHMVDIYVNNDLLVNNFRFRKATPYISVPAGVELTIGVAPKNSQSADDIIATLPPVVLEGGQSYLAIANGVLDPSTFAANPDGRDTAFRLFIKEMAREMSSDEEKTDVFVFHGATDAPMVDVIERLAGKIVDDAGYGDMTDYLTLPANSFYYLDVETADNAAIVGSFKTGFYKHGGEGAVIFASGFLIPENNMKGEGFGLFIAYPYGRVDRLPLLDSARLQVIHNSADPAAAQVDIYANETLLIPNFEFRTATPFIDVPANTPLSIGVAPAGSMGPEEIILTLPPLTLLGGKTYVAVAVGVVGDGFAPNPEGKDIIFALTAYDMAQEKAKWIKYVEFAVLHRSTDAPRVDVLVNGETALVENLAYGMFTDYLRVSPAMYQLDITPAGMPGTVVASFDADLSGLAGGAAVVFASGFLSPMDNNNGPGFGLFAALPSGDVVEFPSAGVMAKANSNSQEVTSLPTDFSLEQNYPNPFNPTTSISFALPEQSDVKVVVYDMRGNQVAMLINGETPAGSHSIVWNGTDNSGLKVASGLYFYSLEANNYKQTRKMMLVK